MSIRDRIIRVGENNDPYNHSHNDAMLAAAREALLAYRERCRGERWWTYGAEDELDSLLAELSDGQTAQESK